MSTAAETSPHRGAREDVPLGEVASRLAELRALAASEPARAQDETWKWVLSLGAQRQHGQLQTLFALGTAPHQLDGPTEGAFLAMAPTRLGAAVSPAVAALGRRYWTGKYLEHESSTGGNLLTPRVRRVFQLLRVGADFQTRLGTGITGSAPEVLLLDYSGGHGNGRLGRVLDEVVEIVPDTYLLRGMWRRDDREPATLCYVALRQPATPR